MSTFKYVVWTPIDANIFQRLFSHAKITSVSMATEVCTIFVMCVKGM